MSLTHLVKMRWEEGLRQHMDWKETGNLPAVPPCICMKMATKENSVVH